MFTRLFGRRLDGVKGEEGKEGTEEEEMRNKMRESTMGWEEEEEWWEEDFTMHLKCFQLSFHIHYFSNCCHECSL